MKNADNRVVQLLRRLFANPWAVCVLTAALGAIAAALAIDRKAGFQWKEVASGAIFGLAVGLLYVVDTFARTTPGRKRALGAAVGACGGLVMALLLAAPACYVSASAIVGAVLGATGKFWIYHVNLP